ncbi:MAG: carbohydrate binding domain-containing protein [Acidobacteria bacterium]|nr:carbohydrate binding domain-containing protein [Acidobacteriota bacterium]
MQDIATIGGPRGRIFGICIAVFAVSLAFVGAKWQLGDMLARLTRATDDNAAFIADGALGLAPSDPYANALRAEVGEYPDSPDDRSAVEMAEQTVRLSPYDHRWSIALARALASDGQTDRAKSEFERAIELAPTYADGHWYYGNFLLRQGRRDEAIAELRIAASNDSEYRPHVLSLMWDYSAHDPAVLESVAGDGVDNLAQLAFFLANHGRGSDAVRNWNRLSEVEKTSRNYIARVIAQGLVDQHRYFDGLEFSRQLGADANAKPETITNGSFETSIEPSQDSHFNWRLGRNDPKLDIALDDRVRHDGNRSLRLTFKSTAKPDLFNVAQTVAMAPGAKYRLTFWLRTESLKTAAGPLIDVATGDESTTLARTQPFPNGTNDWKQVSVDFAIPAGVDGIEIRTVRLPCSGDDCPISGIVWYDDFVLTRL